MDDIKILESVTDLRENNDHKGIISVIYSYLYRHLYLISQILNDGEELKWLEKAKRERTLIKNNFPPGSIDTKIYNTFMIEYYLILIEYIGHADKLDLDEDDIEDYKDEIKAFIKEAKKQQDSTKYLQRIEQFSERL